MNKCQFCDQTMVKVQKFCSRKCSNKFHKESPRSKWTQTEFCVIEDCGERSHSRSMCKPHYARWNRTGSADTGIPGKKCSAGCTCNRHRHFKRGERIPSIPCKQCGAISGVGHFRDNPDLLLAASFYLMKGVDILGNLST